MLTRLKKQFLDLPIAQKFVSIFTVMTLLSCAVMVGALHLGLSVFEEKLYEKSLQELDFFVQNLDDDLQEMDVLTRSIAVDSRIQDQLAELTAATPETAQYYYELTGVRPLLLEKLYQSGQADSLQYIDAYGNVITVGQSFPDPGDDRRAELTQKLDDTPGGFVLLPPDADYPYYVCGRKILRSQNMSMQDLGTTLVTVDIEKLLDNQIDALSNKPSELYLYNKEVLVYQSGSTAAGLTPPTTRQGYAVQSIGGQKVFVCWLTSNVSGLRLCSVFNYSEIYGQTSRARVALLLGGCAILVLFGWVMLRMARLVTRPVHTLSEAVKSVEGGDFTTARAMLPAVPAADEIGTLTRDVDAMLGQIDTLIHENYEKQLLLQDTRYKMLQAQINPHFLYNTLSTLSWLVRAGKNEDAGRLIINLGDMLRAALSPKQNTTAAADVQLVRSYIEIQQLRYKRRAAFTLQTDGDLESWYLPHFTLQPLVENAIKYGVEESEDVCEITVTAKADGDTLLLAVHNTGAPINADRLAEMRSFTVKPQGHGIGLKNIYERLSMLYTTFTFAVDSTETDGTTVKIILDRQNVKEEAPHGETADR